MDEFALCWKNFQDNIADGFHGLWLRGDLVDVTLATGCGKLLHAHKIVLAICSPYFQEMFLTNPCKHPIIILKDVTYEVMNALLQFMYQGLVNVKHQELPIFMKVAQSLQIKGLTKLEDNDNCTGGGDGGASTATSGGAHKYNTSSGAMTPPLDASTTTMGGSKRSQDVLHETYPIMPKRRQPQRLMAELLHQVQSQQQQQHHHHPRTAVEGDVSNSEHSGEDNLNNSDVLMPAMSLNESSTRFDLGNVKRENVEQSASPSVNSAERTPLISPFNFDFNGGSSGHPPGKSHTLGNAPGLPYKFEYPNDVNDFSKSVNHMEIPAGASVTMLSATSLLHGNCVFNRNNTVATQQGMKTYWLCKSYRVSMCRARCITHQGRIISATGVHNHAPHIKSNAGHSEMSVPEPVEHCPSLVTSTTTGTMVMQHSSVNPSSSSSPPTVGNAANNSPLITVTVNSSGGPPSSLINSSHKHSHAIQSLPAVSHRQHNLANRNATSTGLQQIIQSSQQQESPLIATTQPHDGVTPIVTGHQSFSHPTLGLNSGQMIHLGPLLTSQQTGPSQMIITPINHQVPPPQHLNSQPPSIQIISTSNGGAAHHQNLQAVGQLSQHHSHQHLGAVSHPQVRQMTLHIHEDSSMVHNNPLAHATTGGHQGL